MSSASSFPDLNSDPAFAVSMSTLARCLPRPSRGRGNVTLGTPGEC